jgi:hypothetical protein
MHAHPLLHSDYFTGEFLPKFDLKNMISTSAKDFSWEKLPKFARFQKEKIPNRQIFMISSSM